MFELTKLKGVDGTKILVTDSQTQTQACIHLWEGARLVYWRKAGREIIGEPEGGYGSHFAGALLIPFANRVNKGRFYFKNNWYQLNPNGPQGHAIHGLVYDRSFTYKRHQIEKDHLEISMECNYDGSLEGYPFPFQTIVTYCFTKTGMHMGLQVKNTGRQSLPITIGWHPYFFCRDRSTAILECDVVKTFLTDQSGITRGVEEQVFPSAFVIQNHKLDTAYLLKKKEITLKTSSHSFTLVPYGTSEFLQLYTPKDRRYLAVEPMTGISDSFNNGKGLKELQPNKETVFNCTIKILEHDY